jgi:hypothetical protein
MMKEETERVNLANSMVKQIRLEVGFLFVFGMSGVLGYARVKGLTLACLRS